MFKPPMKQLVTVYVPNGEKDRYGRLIGIPEKSKARVKQSVTVTKNAVDGTEVSTKFTIDLPAEIPLTYGVEIEYTDEQNITTKGEVVTIEAHTNVAGNRVFYRTVAIA